jgi:hypothetical protein
VRREGRELARDAIVKPDADGDQQIALGHCHVRGVSSVHAQHAEA